MAINLEQNYDYLASHLMKLKTLRASLGEIDAEAVDCLKDAVEIFAAAQIEQKELARRLGVGAPTVSRWSTTASRPRSLIFRKALLGEMERIMTEIVIEHEERLGKLRKVAKRGRRGGPEP
jgi:DNA-binding transcriptional regulator YiaG